MRSFERFRKQPAFGSRRGRLGVERARLARPRIHSSQTGLPFGVFIRNVFPSAAPVRSDPDVRRHCAPCPRPAGPVSDPYRPFPPRRLRRPYGFRMKLIVFARRRIVLRSVRVHGVANNGGGETSTDRRAKRRTVHTHVRTQTRQLVPHTCRIAQSVAARRVYPVVVGGAVVRVMTCADILLPSRQRVPEVFLLIASRRRRRRMGTARQLSSVSPLFRHLFLPAADDPGATISLKRCNYATHPTGPVCSSAPSLRVSSSRHRVSALGDCGTYRARSCRRKTGDRNRKSIFYRPELSEFKGSSSSFGSIGRHPVSQPILQSSLFIAKSFRPKSSTSLLTNSSHLDFGHPEGLFPTGFCCTILSRELWLRALHVLPNAIFFSRSLRKRVIMPSVNRETHNLIVTFVLRARNNT